LDTSEYGLSASDMCSNQILSSLADKEVEISIDELINKLQSAYCGNISAEFTHLLVSRLGESTKNLNFSFHNIN